MEMVVAYSNILSQLRRVSDRHFLQTQSSRPRQQLGYHSVSCGMTWTDRIILEKLMVAQLVKNTPPLL